MQRILFLQKGGVLDRQEAQIRSRLGAALPGVEIVFADAPAHVPQASFPVVVAPTLPWLPDALRRVEDLAWIHFLSAGVEQIWEMPFDWRGVAVTNSRGIHGQQMSEYAIGAMLYFAKGFDRFAEQSRSRQWRRFWLDELGGETVMILGLGEVGVAVAERCKAFGMRVVAVQNRVREAPFADQSVDLQGARARLPEVSYLVVCLPLTPATRGLVDASWLGALRSGAVLVDMSRGGVVVERDLLALLDAGRLRGAALDVFEVEPLPEESALWGRPDVLLTPHVAGTSPHYLDRALDLFVRNAHAWREGRDLLTPVDISRRY
jgi:phosphoglycerate dehydrogenase-like enzyme